MATKRGTMHESDPSSISSDCAATSRLRVGSIRVDRLLSRVSDQYPWGLPHTVLLGAKERHLQGRARYKRALFLLASVGSTISVEESALLTSIVEKGLALTKEQVEIQVCELSKHGNELPEWIRTQSVLTPSIVVIAMGFQQSPHGTWTGESTPILHTVSLTEVLSSKESKRLFWGHLQGVITRLNEGVL
jgi:hypothetical protein